MVKTCLIEQHRQTRGVTRLMHIGGGGIPEICKYTGKIPIN